MNPQYKYIIPLALASALLFTTQCIVQPPPRHHRIVDPPNPVQPAAYRQVPPPEPYHWFRAGIRPEKPKKEKSTRVMVLIEEDK